LLVRSLAAAGKAQQLLPLLAVMKYALLDYYPKGSQLQDLAAGVQCPSWTILTAMCSILMPPEWPGLVVRCRRGTIAPLMLLLLLPCQVLTQSLLHLPSGHSAGSMPAGTTSSGGAV
jgi:hypothetical protein